MHYRDKEPASSFAEYIAKVNYAKALILTFSISIYLTTLIIYYLFDRDLTVTRNRLYFFCYCLLFIVFAVSTVVFFKVRKFRPKQIKLFNYWLNGLGGFTMFWSLAYTITDLKYNYPLPVLSFLTACMVFMCGLILSPVFISIVFIAAWVVFNFAGSWIIYHTYFSLHLFLTSVIYIGIGLIVMYTNYRIRRRDFEQAHILNNLNQELETAVRTDFLTGLGNRLAFDETFASIKKECSDERIGLGLLFIDIDNFKTVNDKLGHQKGDEVLKYTSNLIKNLHPNAFRFGGEEFIILIKSESPEDLMRQSTAICREVEKALAPFVDGLNITVSIGVHFEMPPIDATSYDFINLADNALYQAKKAGKNRAHLQNPRSEQ
ncbi:MAG TPA: diguanylate cyclase [Bacilli bacterium]|nr:diguanylate cyclase [Bacilli bacterium]